jgi:hypothetical protein
MGLKMGLPGAKPAGTATAAWALRPWVGQVGTGGGRSRAGAVRRTRHARLSGKGVQGAKNRKKNCIKWLLHFHGLVTAQYQAAHPDTGGHDIGSII